MKQERILREYLNMNKKQNVPYSKLVNTSMSKILNSSIIQSTLNN